MRNKVLALVGALAVASASGAQTIFYDNIQGFNNWATKSYYAIRGTNDAVPLRHAQSWSPNQTGTVHEITVGLQNKGLGAGSGTMSLLGPSGGLAPGAVLESLTFPGTPVLDSTNSLTVSGFNTNVTAGQLYWVLIEADPASALAWKDRPDGLNSHQATQSGNPYGSWLTGSSMGRSLTVEGSVVPEPATITALAAGALALLRRRRSKPA